MQSREVPRFQVRALFDAETIRVYQAYNDEIADAALATGTFVPPFSMNRMTWVKPSFLWMMYRCGWGTKKDQQRVLAVDITRSGFEWALRHSSLSHGPTVDKSKPVRVQWDPERSITLEKLQHRSIQIGLSGAAVVHYVEEWIVGISEVTELAGKIQVSRDQAILPMEHPYPLPEDIAEAIDSGSKGG